MFLNPEDPGIGEWESLIPGFKMRPGCWVPGILDPWIAIPICKLILKTAVYP